MTLTKLEIINYEGTNLKQWSQRKRHKKLKNHYKYSLKSRQKIKLSTDYTSYKTEFNENVAELVSNYLQREDSRMSPHNIKSIMKNTKPLYLFKPYKCDYIKLYYKYSLYHKCHIDNPKNNNYFYKCIGNKKPY